jgi:hypothetical protein
MALHTSPLPRLPSDFTVLPNASPLLRELILAEQRATDAERDALARAVEPILKRIEGDVVFQLLGRKL